MKIRTTVSYILMAVLVAGIAAKHAACSEPNDTVLRYLEALKNGDVATIMNTIDGELLEKRRVLLAENDTYSRFLKKFYQGAVFEIKGNRISGTIAQSSVEVYFDDRQSNFELLLNLNDEGKWKIIDEVSSQ